LLLLLNDSSCLSRLVVAPSLGRKSRRRRTYGWSGNALDAFAERFVQSIKTECLDRMIFFGEASLRHAVSEYVAHYHEERTHQGRDNRLLFPRQPSDPMPRDGPIKCRERLGGLLKFYYREAG
jgi:hypothetical protein